MPRLGPSSLATPACGRLPSAWLIKRRAIDAAQDAQRPNLPDLFEGATADGTLDHMPRRLTTISRVGKDIMNGQCPAHNHMVGEGRVIVLRRGLGVVSVQEQEVQRRRPPSGHLLRAGDDDRDDIRQISAPQCVPQGRQGVQHSSHGIDEVRVVPLPARLILFRTTVVIDGDQVGAGRTCRATEVNGRFAAIRADLQPRTSAGSDRCVVQRRGLILGKEPLDIARDGE